MPAFYRIFNNVLYNQGEVEKLGWSLQEDFFEAPDEYIEKREFVIHRSCFSLGDWGIISAMPRILKTHYPDCKVYITSPKFVESIYGPAHTNPQNVWGIWSNPYEHILNVFKYNPYIDDFIDTFDGEIYHDHFRIRDYNNINDPLILQMLRFHKIYLNLDDDYIPELYFSDEEIEKFSKIKTKLFGDSEYGSFSYRHVNNIKTKEKILHVQEKLNKYSHLPFMVYTNIEKEFSLNKVVDSSTIQDVRLLMYLNCNAKVCAGTQTGMYDTCSRYTTTDCLTAQSINEISEHYLPSVNYTFV